MNHAPLFADVAGCVAPLLDPLGKLAANGRDVLDLTQAAQRSGLSMDALAAAHAQALAALEKSPASPEPISIGNAPEAMEPSGGSEAPAAAAAPRAKRKSPTEAQSEAQRGKALARIRYLRNSRFGHLSDDLFAELIDECTTRGWPPEGVFAAVRYSEAKERDEVIPMTTIECLRSMAGATGDYGGPSKPEWLGADGKWVDAWPHAYAPRAARVSVRRHSFVEPTAGVAHWDQYAPMVERRDGLTVPEAWEGNAGAQQLAKCAEALGIRRAFWELGTLYVREELDQLHNPRSVRKAARPETDLDEGRTIVPTEEFVITRQGFEQALWRAGFTVADQRAGIVERYRAKYPGLLERDSHAFYQRVLAEVLTAGSQRAGS